MPRSRSRFPAAKRSRRETLNGRLGIVGGLSILGTTGIVVPYSCSAWIHSIHRGIDVARAAGLTHIAGATGANSEAAVQKLHGLPEIALIDMGDFVGGMLKYVRAHPLPRVTIAGGVAKMTKLAQGLHRSSFQARRGRSRAAGAVCAKRRAAPPNFARASSQPTPPPKPLRSRKPKASRSAMKSRARRSKRRRAIVAGRDIAIEIAVFDRDGALVGRAPFQIRIGASSRRASAEPAAIVGIIERAVAKILARPARGRQE